MSYFGKRKKKAVIDHETGSSGRGPGNRNSGEGITSSMEKFSIFGFLTPALVLVPAADGVRYNILISLQCIDSTGVTCKLTIVVVG